MLALLLLAAPPPSGLDVDPWVALAVTGAAVAGTIVAAQIPVPEEPSPGGDELLPFDTFFQGTYRLEPHRLSNATLLGALATPLVAQLGLGADGAGDATLVYAEALSTTLLLNMVTKRTVQRARPYTHDPSAPPGGADASLSFYSGHAASSFVAATVAGLGVAARTRDEAPRATAWGVGLALASSTAVLRVRAGMHFPSDVAIGALAGLGVGILLPVLHASADAELAPSGPELAAMLGGLLGGGLLAAVWPVEAPPPLALAPLPGGGFALLLTP